MHRLRFDYTLSRENWLVGVIELGIFNAEIWASDGDVVLAQTKSRYAELAAPWLMSAG